MNACNLEKKIITILGDSLSMVRNDEDVTLRTIYPYLLVKFLGNDYYIINKSKRGNTSDFQTLNQYLYDDVETSDSSIVILQIGICDCSPRIISKFEKIILNYFLPVFLSFFYIKFKSKHRYFFTKYFPKTYVTKARFESNYKQLLESILKLDKIQKIIIINIADTNEYNKKRSYNFEQNIIDYNRVIQKLAFENPKIQIIDSFNYSKTIPNFLLSDGIHISNSAHQILAENISKLII